MSGLTLLLAIGFIALLVWVDERLTYNKEGMRIRKKLGHSNVDYFDV